MSKNKHNESVGSEVVRSDERIAETGEVFTPAELCDQMVSEIPESIVKDPNSTFLDNSAELRNFLVALQRRLQKYHSLQHINDNMLYCVELMEDNHAELCNRLGVSTAHPHFVCANALEYDYSFGKLGRGLGVYVTVWRVSQGVSDVGMVYPIIWRYQTEQTMTNNIESIQEQPDNQVDHIMALCESYVEADQLEDVGNIRALYEEYREWLDQDTTEVLWITLGQLNN